MSRKDGILDLVVKTAPFRDLKSGAKREEYRADKPGKSRWRNRLLTEIALDLRTNCELREDFDFRPYHTARISLGYAHDRESFTRKIKRIRWGKPNPVLTYGIVSADECFVIELEAPE